MSDRREHGHIETALGDQYLGGVDLDAGDRAQQLDNSLVRGEHELDPLAEVLERGVESVDVREQLRKIIKTRGHFPTEDAARKLIYLAITKAETRWKRVFHWPTALAEFKIQFGDRIPDNAI